MVEKFCKCPGDSFCPVTYAKNDEYSISVNTRTQMKFCQPVKNILGNLKVCDSNDIALSIRSTIHLDTVQNTSVSLLCSCWEEGEFDKKHKYWRHHMRSGEPIDDEKNLFEVVDNYKCVGKDFFQTSFNFQNINS